MTDPTTAPLERRASELDRKLRERAKAQLRKEATEALKPIRSLIFSQDEKGTLGNQIALRNEGVKFSYAELLYVIENAIVDHYADQRGDVAIEEFITRVDSLQEELDRLKGES